MAHHVLVVDTLMVVLAPPSHTGHSRLYFTLLLLQNITTVVMRYVDVSNVLILSWSLSNLMFRFLQYLNLTDIERPGGNLVSAIVQLSWNTSITYRLLGDNASVTVVFDALVANCSVVNSTSAITSYMPSPDTWPLPEQIIQYYRASTFALSLDGYNNTAALPASVPAENSTAPWPLSQDSPLPAGLNETFLACVNATVGASVPLMDVASHKLSASQIAYYVMGSIVGFFIVAAFLESLIRCCVKKKRRRC